MYNWKERFENAPDAAMNFANELKAARLGALADAEGWMPLVLAFERLGKFLVNDRKANLGSAKNEIIELAKLGAARVRAGAIDGIPIETLVKLVKDGRVVSVKFCKSGSVVRGFGEIKRFMGRV
jgi:hypothetical protein